MFRQGKFILLLLLAVSASLFGAGQQGGTYPRGPITFVVPYKAGGGTDALARMVQKALKDSGALKVPVVIQNIDGGGSLIGMREVLNAKPDGQTFLFHQKSGLISPAYGKANFSYRDFTPVAQFGETPFVYLVREDAPYQTLADLARAKNVNLRNTPGSTVDVINAMLIEVTGNTSFNLVNSGSGSSSLQLLLSGQLGAGAFSLSEYSQYRHQGTRALALLASKPLPEFPELVPAKDQGVDLSFSQMHFLLAPPNTPDDIVAFISSALKKALALPETEKAFKQQGLETAFKDTKEFVPWLNEEGTKIESIVQNVLLARE